MKMNLTGGKMAAYEEESLKSKIGSSVEQDVCDYLMSLGYNAKRYKDRNGQQLMFLDMDGQGAGYFTRYPDIEVYSSGKEIELKMLVEVKSFGNEKIVDDSFFGKLFSKSKNKNLKLGDRGVYIKVVQFKDYLRVSDHFNKPTRVVFVIRKTGEWLWEKIEKLDNKKFQVDFEWDGEVVYFWKTSDLRTDFSRR